MRPIRVLELRSVRGTGGGPEKTILLGAARSEPSQFAVTVCYLRDARDGVFGIDAKAARLPVDYVEVRERHSLDPMVWPRLRALVRERQIDIVHAHEYKSDLLAWLLHKAEGVVPLATAHGWTGHSARERRVYYPLDKQILRLYPKVIAVSDDIRRELIQAGVRADTTQTVLNGIDHQQFVRDRAREPDARARLGLTGQDVVIGSVGRLEPQKRFDLLIDAVARLSPAHPALRLLIVGDGSLRAVLAQQIAQRQLGGVCQLLGHRDDIPLLHHAFDLFVQSSDYEGTPNAVLEAMAFETPTVATDAGGTAQILRHERDGLIVPAGNAAVLADAIAAALGDRDTTAARAASARRRVEGPLSFAARNTTLESIYRELCAGRWTGMTAATAKP